MSNFGTASHDSLTPTGIDDVVPELRKPVFRFQDVDNLVPRARDRDHHRLVVPVRIGFKPAIVVYWCDPPLACAATGRTRTEAPFTVPAPEQIMIVGIGGRA